MVMHVLDLLNAGIEHSHVVVVIVVIKVVVLMVLLRHVVVLIVVIERDLICFELSRVELLG